MKTIVLEVLGEKKLFEVRPMPMSNWEEARKWIAWFKDEEGISRSVYWDKEKNICYVGV